MTENELLTRKDAAKFLGISHFTLTQWAVKKTYHLPFIRVGRSVRYELKDLQKFLQDRKVKK